MTTIAPPTGTGSSTDIVARVKQEIPKRWFRWVAPYRDAILGGLADSAAWCYGLILYARAQTRLASAYGIWLDILCYDFLGRFLTRTNANDDAFRVLVRATILQERVTRKGMIAAITALTGRAPWIFEPWNTFDTGAYSGGAITKPAVFYNAVGLVSGASSGAGSVVSLQIGLGDAASVAPFTTGDTVTVAGVGGTVEANGTWVIAVVSNKINLIGTTFVHAWTSGGTVTDKIITQAAQTGPPGPQYGSFGYNVGQGGYGSMNLPGQTFIKVTRGSGSGVPNVGGYGNNVGGYGVGSLAYVGPTSELWGITDAMIYKMISMTKPTGTIAWVAFQIPTQVLITESGSVLTGVSGDTLVTG